MIRPALVRPYSRAGGMPGFLLRVEDGTGHFGWGDAAPWPGFGDWERASELADALTIPENGDGDGSSLPVEARHAWELARLDLEARRAGVPLCDLLVRPALGASAQRRVAVHALVTDAEDAVRALARGATHFKVKVGGRSLGEEDGRIWSIRAVVGPKRSIRLDANGAWTVEEASRALERLAQWDIEYVEQPVPAGPNAPRALAEIRQRTGVAIAADESLTSAASLDELIAEEAIDVAVIKPMFVGGPLKAAALAERARATGLRTIITHAFGSRVDRLGALHVAAAVMDPATACGVGRQGDGAWTPVSEAPGLGLGAQAEVAI